MVDQLDTEALSFMQSKQSQFPNSKPIRDINVTYGGKVKTSIGKSDRQRRTNKYISDEPERFIKYIEDIKDEFTTEKAAKEAIRAKFKDDESLANLIHGMDRLGVTEREIDALLATKKVQGWFGYKGMARRLRMSAKELKRLQGSINVREYERVKENKRIKAKPNEIFYQTRQGSVKGRATQGRLSPVRIFSKVVVRYRDAKGHFIKV